MVNVEQERENVGVLSVTGWLTVGLAVSPAVAFAAWTSLPAGSKGSGWQGVPIGWEQPARLQFLTIAMLSTGLVAATFTQMGLSWLSVAYVVAFLGMLTVSVVDVIDGRIPNRVIYPTLAATLLLLGVQVWAHGTVPAFTQAVLVGLASGAFLFAVHLISPRGMGMGDVRLALLCGLVMGWQPNGPILAILGLLFAFMAGSVVGVVKLAHEGTGRQTSLRFGPFLSAGAVLVVLYGDRITSLLHLS